MRAKSRRNKNRPSVEGVPGGGGDQEERNGKVDWANVGDEHQPMRSSVDRGDHGGSGKKERRPKSKGRRGERGDLATGGRADEGKASGYPSLLDSKLWKGGGEVDRGGARAVAGGSPGSGADLYDDTGG